MNVIPDKPPAFKMEFETENAGHQLAVLLRLNTTNRARKIQG
jgi:hypothetical protein